MEFGPNILTKIRKFSIILENKQISGIVYLIIFYVCVVFNGF